MMIFTSSCPSGLCLQAFLLKIYSRQIRSAVSIAPAAAAKRHISLCGCVHNFILAVNLLDRQYNSAISDHPLYF